MATKKSHTTAQKTPSTKVDIEPRKMAAAIAVLAVVILILVGIIATSA